MSRKGQMRSTLALLMGLVLFACLGIGPTDANQTAEHAQNVKSDVADPLSSIPWLDAQRRDDVVYFLYSSPGRVERYDLAQEKWLTAITINPTPTAFTTAPEGLYVAMGMDLFLYPQDGTPRAYVYSTTGNIISVAARGQFVYAYSMVDSSNGLLASINKSTGAVIDTRSSSGGMYGVSLAQNAGKLFGHQKWISPVDIVQVTLNDDGTLSDITDSPHHDSFPPATQTYVTPNEKHVVANSGIAYRTDTLYYTGSLGDSFSDLAFNGDEMVAIQGASLVGYSATFVETGRHTPALQPLKIAIKGGVIYCFQEGIGSIGVAKVPLSALQGPLPAPVVNPSALAYTPDAIVVGNGPIVYLLSSSNRNVFRWSVSDRRYLSSIPLVDQPTRMAYSSPTNHLYFASDTRSIMQVDLNGPLVEEPFASAPYAPCGLATASRYVFTCDPSAPWYTHRTYTTTGELVSSKDWNMWSNEYAWSEATRRMYFMTSWSPVDLFYEPIGPDGIIGERKDSPYHDSNGWGYPIRVAPDGSKVVLGTGRVVDGTTMSDTGWLANPISDAAWISGTLITARASAANTELQKWDSSYQAVSSRTTKGTPLRISAIDDGLLVITSYWDRPWFSIWDENLNLVYETPIFRSYVPTVSRVFAAAYHDDFSSPTSGWPVSSDYRATMGYIDGSYSIWVHPYGYMALADNTLLSASDFRVEVDVRTARHDNGRLGLAFSRSGTGFYHFYIGGNQAGLLKYSSTGSPWSTLWGPTTSGAILPAGEVNRLRVTREGNSISLAINGQPFAYVIDGSYVAGHIALVASSIDPEFEGRFDNLDFNLSGTASTVGLPDSKDDTPRAWNAGYSWYNEIPIPDAGDY